MHDARTCMVGWSSASVFEESNSKYGEGPRQTSFTSPSQML